MVSNSLGKSRKLHKHRYLPGLDGFRAIAVLAIIIFHLNPKWLPGGFLGVDTFFVISGYLITALLVAEFHKEGKVDLIAFWGRRLKRLLPAVLFMLMMVLLYTVIFEAQILASMKQDFIAALLYVSNWWYIYKDVDYFNQFAIAPLKHLWSLAVEEQFYFIYPLLLYVLLKFKSKSFAFKTLFVMSLISLCLMIVIADPIVHHSRVYFGTDTRLQTLLLGALLALIWPPFRLSHQTPRTLKVIIDSLGMIGLIALTYFFIKVNEDDFWIYNGGFYAISFVTLFIVASVVHPTGFFAKVMGNRLFVYVGKRSYSLYLWHFPIIVFLHSHFVNGQIPFYVYIIDIILIVLMSELSYRFIETPIRKKGLYAFAIIPLKQSGTYRLLLLFVLMTITFLVFYGTFDVQNQTNIKKETSINTVHKEKKDTSSKEKNKTNKFDEKDLEPLLIGDSIMIDIGNVFLDKVPKASVDGKVGRQLVDANTLIKKQYGAYTKENKDIVLQLGTNGDFTKAQLDELIKNINGANVYLVTVRVPKSYEQNVNKLIYDAANTHKNVHVVDWYKASENHNEYFAYDGIHLEYEGAKALSDLIINKMKQNK